MLHHIDATDASFACIIRDKCSSGIEFIKNLESRSGRGPLGSRRDLPHPGFLNRGDPGVRQKMSQHNLDMSDLANQVGALSTASSVNSQQERGRRIGEENRAQRDCPVNQDQPLDALVHRERERCSVLERS